MIFLIVHTFQNRYRQKETEIDREGRGKRERERVKLTYLKNFKNIKRIFSIRIHPNDEDIQTNDEPSGGKRKRMTDGTKRHGR